MPIVRRKPEIMAPAGYWPQLRAAIEAGADSVYFGLKHFTARAKVGFSIGELPEAMKTLHARGVRGFVTFNTLIFDHEIEEAARAIARIAEAGADAIIIQDAGILKLARRIAPELEIHASTQMSVTDIEGVRLAAELGASRVTLARELSLKEIRAIAEQADVELEVFVHGALCVAYSGQCLSSEAWGGRSANRGLCAQACRLPYELVVDGETRPLGDARYLLSPEDLFALQQVPDLVELGIAALKIEGRYKEPDYVAAATAAYRRAVDDAWAGRKLGVSDEEILDLQQVYSRGMGPHFISGVNHQAVVAGRAPRHRGVRMGEVVRVESGSVQIRPSRETGISPLKPGDGIVFDAADWRSPEEPEEGGRLFEVEQTGKLLALGFARGAIDFDRIRPGDLVWRTSDPAVEKRLRVFTEADAPVRTVPVEVSVEARVGTVLTTRWSALGHTVTVRSSDPVPEARNQGLTRDVAAEQLGRLGGTAYHLEHLELAGEGRCFAPLSLLNQMRREAVRLLDIGLCETNPARTTDPVEVTEKALLQLRTAPVRNEPGTALHLLVRDAEQLDAAVLERPDSITLDYLDLYGLKPSVERVKAEGIAVRVATPRVMKPGEERIVDFLLRLECPLLVRPAGLLSRLGALDGLELTGDFSLNAANALSAAGLIELGLRRITPAHDLNAAQIAALARAVGGRKIEAVLWQHLPVFHTEHCVFCRFMSTGTSFEDCGRPCEKHRVELRDPNGRSHPVLADTGCRNTVFGAEAQQASLFLKDWLAAGIRDFRLEFTHESGSQVRGIASAFREAIDAGSGSREMMERLMSLSPGGITQGSLFVAPGFEQLPVLE